MKSNKTNSPLLLLPRLPPLLKKRRHRAPIPTILEKATDTEVTSDEAPPLKLQTAHISKTPSL